MNFPILYQNQDLLLINKPAGVVVNEGETVVGETVQAWMQQFLADLPAVEKDLSWQELVPSDFSDEFGSVEEIWQERQGIVHRLDKDTSGVLLLAKNPGALVNLLAQFKKRQTQKTYLALVHGKFKVKEGKLSAPIARASHNRLKFTVSPEGKAAETFYHVKEEFAELDLAKLLDLKKLEKKRAKNIYQQGFSLVEAQPKTGRTHQIRVHFSSMQHPLVGDKTYSGKKRAKFDALWCQRHFLHAQSLIFTDPRSQERLEIKAELTADLQAVLENLTIAN
jgi:23S rRNA pseudouridine1911/1915/1917 synthase